MNSKVMLDEMVSIYSLNIIKEDSDEIQITSPHWNENDALIIIRKKEKGVYPGIVHNGKTVDSSLTTLLLRTCIKLNDEYIKEYVNTKIIESKIEKLQEKRLAIESKLATEYNIHTFMVKRNEVIFTLCENLSTQLLFRIGIADEAFVRVEFPKPVVVHPLNEHEYTFRMDIISLLHELSETHVEKYKLYKELGGKNE